MTKICLVNLTELDPPINGGTARVARAVCQLLLKDNALRLVFLVNWKFESSFAFWLGMGFVPGHIIPYINAPDAPSPAEVIEQIQPDLILSPLFGMKPFDDPALCERIPHITAVPDALALDKPELFPGAQSRQPIYAALRHAARVVAVSEYARGRLLHHLSLDPARVVVAYHGAQVSEVETRLSPDEAPPGPFVLYPANDWPHKRHDLLLQAMQHIWAQRPALKLVLTGGRHPQGNRIPALMARYGVPPERVLDLGYVPDATLQGLYQLAEAMLFTSAHEGFGMPLVEAMQNHCPVICAPLTAIPEVAGDAALYVDSDDPAAWARAFLDDLPPQREMLVHKGAARAAQFTWARAKATWGIILEEAGLPLTMPKGPVDMPEKLFNLAQPAKALTQGYQRSIRRRPRTLADLPDSPLKEQLTRLEALREAEQGSRVAVMPLVGALWRLGWRLRSLGMMWQANAQMHSRLIEHIHRLESQITTLSKDLHTLEKRLDDLEDEQNQQNKPG